MKRRGKYKDEYFELEKDREFIDAAQTDPDTNRRSPRLS